jgi:hypothetical protein
VTLRHSPRSRIQFGLLSIALGIAVGILAFIVGRADDDAGAKAGPPKAKLVIHGTGDVSLNPGYIPALGSNGYDWAWSELGGLFRDDDLTIINHECPSHRDRRTARQTVRVPVRSRRAR